MPSSSGEDGAADRLLGWLASYLGVHLRFDDTGQCALLFADDVELIVSRHGDPAVLSVRSLLDGPVASEVAGPLRRALAMNYGRLPPGLAIALDPDSNQLFLLGHADPATLAEEAFAGLIDRVIRLVPALRTQLSSPASAAAEPYAAEPSRALQGMIRG